MTTEIQDRFQETQTLLASVREACSYDQQKVRLGELEEQMSAGDFWENQEAAEVVIQELKRAKDWVTSIEELEHRLEEVHRAGFVPDPPVDDPAP